MLCSPLILLMLSAAEASPEIHTFTERPADLPAHTTDADAVAAYLDSQRLGLPADWLVPARTHRWRGHTITHHRQLHHGVPVEGVGVTITARDGVIRAVRSRRVDGLTVSTQPALSPSEAAQRAQSALGGREVVEATLRVQVTPSGGALLYRLTLSRDGLLTEAVDVDAHSGVVVGVQTLQASASGHVYPRELGEDLTAITLTGLDPESSVLDSDIARVRSVVFDQDGIASAEHVAVTEAGGDFDFVPEELAEDAFAEVNVYHHVSELKTYFADKHGLSPPEVDALVSYRTAPGDSFDNAWFTFDESLRYTLTFGEGSDFDYAHDPDIIGHEYSHGVVFDVVEDLIYTPYPSMYGSDGPRPTGGALREGMADWWAATIDDDPQLGHLPDLSGPVRELDGDARCPDDVIGLAHSDGIVLGSAAWQVRELLGAEAADQVIMGALKMLDDHATFSSFAESIEIATQALVEEGLVSETQAEAVGELLAERGLTTCADAVLAEPGEPVETWWMGGDLLGDCQMLSEEGYYTTPPFQLQVTAPDPGRGTLESLDVTVTLSDPSSPLSWTAAVRRDGAVGLTVGAHIEVMGAYLQPITGAELYHASQDSTEQQVTLTFTADDLELVPGSTYTLALLGQSCDTLPVEVTMDFTEDTPPVELGLITAEPAGAGCASLPHPASAAGILAGLLALWRRRQ